MADSTTADGIKADNERNVCPNKKSVFGRVRDELMDASDSLKSIGETELGDRLWDLINKMLHHEDYGSLDPKPVSESANGVMLHKFKVEINEDEVKRIAEGIMENLARRPLEATGSESSLDEIGQLKAANAEMANVLRSVELVPSSEVEGQFWLRFTPSSIGFAGYIAVPVDVDWMRISILKSWDASRQAVLSRAVVAESDNQ